MTVFSDFDLSGATLRSINSMGFEEATPIQEKTIPKCLEGKDLIGQAHTGTGKTAAFGIPMVEKFEVDCEHIQGVVLTPTRELAVQVAEEINRIGQFKRIRALPIYGGQDIDRQIKALKKKPQIIVGTPGRLMDHMRRRTIRLQEIKVVVLDEADEMLNMGFIEDIETILQDTPGTRQTLLFSATIPAAIQGLSAKFMKNPEIIRIGAKQVTVPNLEQGYVEVDEMHKFDVFCRLLDTQSPERAITFCRTKRRVDELVEALTKRGYSAEGIHGDMTQSKRDQVMRQFREGSVDILVATDVAARGLDISGVTHIYNFDIPQELEGYVHRVGRTGRAGATGVAVTLVTPREVRFMKAIEGMTKSKINRIAVPTVKDAFKGQQLIAVDKLLLAVEKGDFDNYRGLAEGLLDKEDSITLISAALKILTKEPDQTPIALTEDRKFVHKRDNSGYRSRGNTSGGNKRGSRSGNSNNRDSSKPRQKSRYKSF